MSDDLLRSGGAYKGETDGGRYMEEVCVKMTEEKGLTMDRRAIG